LEINYEVGKSYEVYWELLKNSNSKINDKCIKFNKYLKRENPK
jgi:hypothetical protein